MGPRRQQISDVCELTDWTAWPEETSQKIQTGKEKNSLFSRSNAHSVIKQLTNIQPFQFRKVERFAAQYWLLITFSRFYQKDTLWKTDDNYVLQAFRYEEQKQGTNEFLSEWEISLDDANVSADIRYSR